MPVELLLLLLAWAAILGLIVVLPWAVIRLTVRVLEADVSSLGAEHGREQSRQPPDAEAVTTLPCEPDAVERMPAAATPDEDTDR